MFLSPCPLANEAGETPLDIAKRLRHEHCEELVSLPGAHGVRAPFLGQVLSGPQGVGPERIPVARWTTWKRHLGSLERGCDLPLPSDAWNKSLYLLVGHVDSGPGIFWGTRSRVWRPPQLCLSSGMSEPLAGPLAASLQSGLSYFVPNPQSFEW